jgi:hypothetical protein
MVYYRPTWKVLGEGEDINVDVEGRGWILVVSVVPKVNQLGKHVSGQHTWAMTNISLSPLYKQLKLALFKSTRVCKLSLNVF